MNTFRQEVEQELVGHILPFWMRMQDKENGGFYGLVDYNLRIHKQTEKGSIALSRFLWSFSAAYRVTKNEEYLQAAHHAYHFLSTKMIDAEIGGIYWAVDYQGNVTDSRKHVYAQAFAIYALSEYYRVTANADVLNLANRLYQLIEKIGFFPERNAYGEEFNREWQEQPNEQLSENGVIADITMNTHLHVLEAYTNLYRVQPSEELRDRMVNLLTIFHEKIYDPTTHVLGVFFNTSWESLVDLTSNGHDIEASWLLDEAIHVLGLKNEAFNRMVMNIAYNIAWHAIQPDGSLANEKEGAHLDLTKVWWVQVEAMVGLVNAYRHTKDEIFQERTLALWAYTKKHLIDPREGGEWYWSAEPNGEPTQRNIGGPWKAAYHNSRFCMEIMERVTK